MKALLDIARPKHWVKNAFVFAPLIFSKQFQSLSSSMTAGLAFLMFCLFSSCVYMMNDVADMEQDRLHPEKRNRPLPSGKLSPSTVIIMAAVLFVISTIISAFLSYQFLLVALVYFVLNILYSFTLKYVVILDGMIIAAGFVLRAYAGAVVIGAEFSDWLYICAIFVSLFLAFSKRRHELLLMGDEQAHNHRGILREYSVPLLDQIIAVVTAATIVTYSLYCIDVVHGSSFPTMKFTIPFVIYGLFRYLYLVYHQDEGGNPTELLLNDTPLLINGTLWIIVVFWALLYS